jgi:hypothetical protein
MRVRRHRARIGQDGIDRQLGAPPHGGDGLGGKEEDLRCA